MCQAQVDLQTSHLPILKINTNGLVIIDEPKQDVQLAIIHNESGINHVDDPANHYEGIIGIEIRGSSSQWFDKKGYGLETRTETGENRNVSLFGFPEENDWILHGPFSDKTLMRNALAYTLAGEIMAYAPRTQFVELLIDNNYQGVYLFCEKIKRDKGRVDVNKMDPEDEDLSGGYILKFDKAPSQSDAFGFFSQFPPFTGAWQGTFFEYHYPKPADITPAQADYIKSYIRNLEEVLFSDNFEDPENGYQQWIDVGSFIDYFIINELSKNPDGYRLSTYMYKDRDSIDTRLHLGPVWDFNLGFGNVDYCTQGNHIGFVVQNFNNLCINDFWVIHFWWEKLLTDPWFLEQLKARWFSLRADVLSNGRLNERIDSMAFMLDEAQGRNFQQFPILNQYIWPNFTVEGSYDAEVDRLRRWVVDRAIWIDNNLDVLANVNFDNTLQVPVKVIPNPTAGEAVLQFYSHENAEVHLRVTDASGKTVMSNFVRDKVSGFNEIHLPAHVPGGVYFYNLTHNGTSHSGSYIKI